MRYIIEAQREIVRFITMYVKHSYFFSAPLEDNDEDQTDNIAPCLYNQRNEDTDDYRVQRTEDWLIGEDPAMFSDEFSDPEDYSVTFDY